MTPTERALLEALRPFAVRDDEIFSPPKGAVQKARELVEHFDGQGEEEYRRLAPSVGADPNWYGKQFLNRRALLTVTGINTKAYSNVMSVKDQHGKIFRCSLDMVRSGMPKPAPAPRTRVRPGTPGQRLLDMGA